MGLAGSEVVTAWIIQALQGTHQVHLCTAGGFDPEAWNRAFGTSLRKEDIQFIQAPRLPFVKHQNMLAYWHRGRFEEFCRTLAPSYDLCISAYNPLRFGRPALHIIGDISWHQRLSMKRGLWKPEGFMSLFWRVVHRVYQAIMNQLYFTRPEQAFTPDDWFLSNSRWTMTRHEPLAPQVHHELLYPPVPVNAKEPQSPKPVAGKRRFISLGRVSYEKRILEKITLLKRLRARGHDLELIVIGGIGSDAFSQRVQKLAEANADWVTLKGALYGEQKNALLRSAEFGLHACADEAFGIAVAELLHQGCLTWVPAGSGSAEIVPDPQFHYRDFDHALELMDQMLKAPPAELQRLRAVARQHVVKNFLPEVFVRSFQQMLARWQAT
jgi:glycosyltransferase involved in cell wall biosynthesis